MNDEDIKPINERVIIMPAHLVDFFRENSKELEEALELLLAHYRKYDAVMGMSFIDKRI